MPRKESSDAPDWKNPDAVQRYVQDMRYGVLPSDEVKGYPHDGMPKRSKGELDKIARVESIKINKSLVSNRSRLGADIVRRAKSPDSSVLPTQPVLRKVVTSLAAEVLPISPEGAKNLYNQAIRIKEAAVERGADLNPVQIPGLSLRTPSE